MDNTSMNTNEMAYNIFVALLSIYNYVITFIYIIYVEWNELERNINYYYYYIIIIIIIIIIILLLLLLLLLYTYKL
jgi:hypothetical protein